MSLQFLLEVPVGLGPVIVFLFILQHLDSFRLVSPYAIGLTIAGGGALAAASYVLNGYAMDLLHADLATYT